MTKIPLIISGIVFLSIIPFVSAGYEDAIVVLETNSGNLVFEFFPDDAPKHVENFIKLTANTKTDLTVFDETETKPLTNYYKGTLFHRIIPGFMIQGGDLNTKVNADNDSIWGQGNPGYSLKAEFNDIKHKTGILSMARGPDPNSAGSQFFIVHKDSTFLDGKYTVFGRLVTQESFETLEKIASLETDQRDIPINRNAPQIIKTEVLTRSDFDNLLDLGLPEREGGMTTAPTENNDGPYVDNKLGFTFLPPIGWMVSQPPQSNANTPQLALLGSVGSDGVPAAFAVNVRDSTLSLDEHILDLENTILPDINSGKMVITYSEKIQFKGFDTYKTTFNQFFQKSESEVIDLKMNLFLIKTVDKLYTLQFTNSVKEYESTEDQFRDILDSFTIIQSQSSPISETESGSQSSPISETESESSEGGGCLIATAAYGSEMAPQVQFLREIRDNTVLQTQSGTSFMTAFNTFYYTFSPTIADYERENPVFKEAVKIGLTPLLTSLTILNYVDIDTEQEMLGYGIGIIMLNIGMYFVAPAVVIIALKNRRK